MAFRIDWNVTAQGLAGLSSQVEALSTVLPKSELTFTRRALENARNYLESSERGAAAHHVRILRCRLRRIRHQMQR